MNELLFSNFPEVTSEEWKNTILKDLKGLPFEKVEWQTEDGLTIEPFYRKENLPNQLPVLNKKERGWKITEGILENKSTSLANETAKKAIQVGTDALLFYSHEVDSKTFGVPLPTPLALPELLKGIDVSLTPVILSLANRTPEFAKEIRNKAKGSKQLLADYDPLGLRFYVVNSGLLKSRQNQIYYL